MKASGLTEQEVTHFKSQVPQGEVIKKARVAELYMTVAPDHSDWSYSNTGIVSITKNTTTAYYQIHFYSLQEKRIVSTEELYIDMECSIYPHFFSFEGEVWECTLELICRLILELYDRI
ncbi:hypothetical protein RF11_08904 [Thelohanellus kitauei]|uniref:WH1 domain-containing protein n=1 Tax=Thelohanellus kitauei TaxID=669202 RepID=A0A0C2J1J5_THEKT|nr:hypothetical protein RF11_08904 [Thelohanellus kitauei]